MRIEYRNRTVKGRENRPICAAIVVFDFGVGAIEGPELKDVVSLDLRKIVLDSVEVFMVAVRRDIPNGLRGAIRSQATPTTLANFR